MIMYQQTGKIHVLAARFLSEMNIDLVGLEDDKTTMPLREDRSLVVGSEFRADHDACSNLSVVLSNYMSTTLTPEQTQSAMNAQNKIAQLKMSLEILQVLGNFSALIAPSVATIQDNSCVEDKAAALTTIAEACRMSAHAVEDSVAVFVPVARAKKVFDMLDQWFPGEQLLKERITAFTLLATEPSPMHIHVALGLQQTRRMNPYEKHKLIDQLLTTVKDNFREAYGYTPEMYYAGFTLPMLNVMIEQNQNDLINALNSPDVTDEDLAQFNISDRNNELYSLCLTMDTPFSKYTIGFLIKEKKIFQELNDDDRAEAMRDWFSRSKYFLADEALGYMYLFGVIGKELSSGDRIAKALQSFDESGDEGVQLRALSVFFSNGLTFLGIDYVHTLLERGNADKADLNKILLLALLKTIDLDGDVELLRLKKILARWQICLDLGCELRESTLSLLQRVKERCETEEDLALYASPQAIHQAYAEQKARRETIAAGQPQLFSPINDLEMTLDFGNGLGLIVEFQSKNIKAQYLNLSDDDRKQVDETLFPDIAKKTYGLEGAGKPEVLTNFGRYGGCYTRRITKVDRLIYVPKGNSKILVYSTEGHPYGKNARK